MTIISVVGAIGHVNPRHKVLVWVGKFADHQNSEVPAMLTLSERAQATGEFSAKGRGEAG